MDISFAGDFLSGYDEASIMAMYKMKASELAAHFLENAKEHSPLSAGAGVDHGVEVETTEDHVNRAADRGCCVSSCSLLPILGAVDLSSASRLALGLAGLVLVLWIAWKSWVRFREWDRRDPLALKKLTLAINVLALVVGTTAIVRLHLQAKQSQQPITPTYQDGGKPDSLKSTPDDYDPLKRQTPSDPASLMQSELYSERMENSSLSQTLPNPHETCYQNLTVAIPYLSLANVRCAPTGAIERKMN